MQLKNVRVDLEANDPALVKMNDILADVLISNLISNAVRYNIDGGFINCFLGSGYLTISNSGLPLTIDPEQLFRRFHKKSENPHSVGLGLSIVKKIVDTYKMKIEYTCIGNIHELRLDFGPIKVTGSKILHET
jgi:signal transduction histidine kinase